MSEPFNGLVERHRARWLDTTHRGAASKFAHRGLVSLHSKSTHGCYPGSHLWSADVAPKIPVDQIEAA